MPAPYSVVVSVHKAALRQQIRHLLAGIESVRVAAECPDGERTLHALREHQPSVVIFDAQMPAPGAMDIAAEIGSAAMPATMFLTEFDRASLRAFEIHSINYLLLPLDGERFRSTFARALRQSEGRALEGARRRLGRLLAADEEGSRERRIPVRNAGRTHYVDLDDIRWVEGFGTLVRLHLDDRTHVVKADLADLAERFTDDFVRIHSVLVRTSEIAEIEREEDGSSVVEYRDGWQIRVGRTGRPEVARPEETETTGNGPEERRNEPNE